MSENVDTSYGLADGENVQNIPAPELNYLPQNPVLYNPGIALIGCGGITTHHLAAYREAGFRVTALCDINKDNANKMRDMFYPDAEVFTDYRELLKRDDIEVIDAATHPNVRYPIMMEAVEKGKHIISQKPFVTDLDKGLALLEKADRAGVRIAVNQNGRWSPHFSYINRVISDGILGDVYGMHASVTWNHNWIAGTPFEKIYFLVLYDFGIHWFDILALFLKDRKPLRVFASTAHSPGQGVVPPFLSQVAVEYEGGQATLSFEADVHYGGEDRTVVLGTKGVIRSEGPDLNKQTVTLVTEKGRAQPQLKGSWFPGGFHGTMGELLCSLEENREPSNSGRENLKSLELCFAALQSASTGQPIVPGKARKLIKL